MTLAVFIIFFLSVVGDAVSLFAGVNYSSVEPLVIHRVKKLALICVYAVHQKR
jgi:ubiquitin-protein ligase E3 C